MIELLRNTKKETNDLLDIVQNQDTEEFYFTENNERVHVNNATNLKKFLKTSHHVYYEYDESTGKKGIILVWKSFGGEIKRSYVKFVADSEITVRRLLTILLWNYSQELHIKLKKDSPFVRLFRAKGFQFNGGRGTEVLLKRPKFILPISTTTGKIINDNRRDNFNRKKYNQRVLAEK